jgi:hypothetical protein
MTRQRVRPPGESSPHALVGAIALICAGGMQELALAQVTTERVPPPAKPMGTPIAPPVAAPVVPAPPPSPKSSASSPQRPRPTTAEKAPIVIEPGLLQLEIIAHALAVRKDPNEQGAIVATVRAKQVLDVVESREAWVRVILSGAGSNARTGWLNIGSNAIAAASGTTSATATARMLVKPIATAADRTRVLDSPEDAAQAAAATRVRPMPEDDIWVQRPMAPPPLTYTAPTAKPDQIAEPGRQFARTVLPVPDRWRLNTALGLTKQNRLDPYNQNDLKGDRPLFGTDWFLNLGAASDTSIELRNLPLPVGAQSTRYARSNDVFGNGRVGSLAQNFILSVSLQKGNTVFKPPDYEFKFAPVINLNEAAAQEVRILGVDPLRGHTRFDRHVGVQELFVDKHLRDVSVNYDFDSVRFGIQPFTADFRGFLFNDSPFGVRLFGTRESNLWQYNLGLFRRLEKDTNSGLNDVGRRMRSDDLLVFNIYRQDLGVLGFTGQATAIYNRNRENGGQFYDRNGFLDRPSVFGDARPRSYDVMYLGANGDGHFDEWNISASAYSAFGQLRNNSFTGRRARVAAGFAAAEVSRDFSWYRVRGSLVTASGDKNPFDDKATGFDAIVENPLIAGADTSYWMRQAVPLVGGGGVFLSARNGLLASLRSSKEHGQSNFINPGLLMAGVGVDVDVLPQLRVTANANKLQFASTAVLAALRNQAPMPKDIGWDLSLGAQWRPFMTQNVILNSSFALLLPGRGLKALYGNAGRPQYSFLLNLTVAY